LHYLIIGNGVAGNEVADTLRREAADCEITLISQEKYPEYSACALPDCLAGWAVKDKLFLKTEEEYKKTNIKISFSETALAINRKDKEVLTSARKIAYDKLFIATGSRALVPPLKGTKLTGNFVLKSMDDLEMLEKAEVKRLVVVGSGNIGIEVAEAMHLKGCEVSIIELIDRIMPKIFDHKASQILEKKIKETGVEVLTSEKVEEILGEGKVEGVKTDRRIIDCDGVVWAVGVRQNTEIAKEAGLEVGKFGGISVDSKMRTSDSEIFACGDCVETFDMLTGEPTLSLLWPSARGQARVAALNALGQEANYEGAFSVVMEDIFGLPATSLGKTASSIAEDQIKIIETENNDSYHQIILENDVFAGYQNIGNPEGAGSMMFMIKNKKTLAELHQTLLNHDLVKRMPHYITAGKLCGIQI